MRALTGFCIRLANRFPSATPNRSTVVDLPARQTDAIVAATLAALRESSAVGGLTGDIRPARVPARTWWCQRALAVSLCVTLLTGVAAAADLRTWTDATGKFKIEAKFKSLADGTVTLEQADGSELEIPLAKLSAADQKIASDLQKAASDNPFKAKPADDPFKPKKPGSGTAPGGSSTGKPAMEGAAEPTETQVLTVDLSKAEKLALVAESDQWSYTPPTPPEAARLRPKTVSLPAKSNFFEGTKRVVVNMAARKAVVGYTINDRRSGGQTRLVLCDLDSPKSGTSVVQNGQMVPLALHRDGRRVLMRRDDSGFGNLDRLEIWSLRGSKADRLSEWVPHKDVEGNKRDIVWAEFVGDDLLVTTSRGGLLCFWSLPSLEVLGYFDTPDDTVPAISPDGKWLVTTSGDHVQLVDVATRKVVCQMEAPGKLGGMHFAFSPSGKRIAGSQSSRALVWDAVEGKLVTEITDHQHQLRGDLGYPHDDFLLFGSKLLLSISEQIKLWTYEGMEATAVHDGWVFIGTSDGTKPGSLLAAQLPHPAAVEMLNKAKNDPNLFLVREGASIKLDVSGIADAAAQDTVTKALTARVESIGCKVDPQAPISLVATVQGPTPKQLNYFRFGTVNTQEWVSTLKFVYQGQTLWTSGGTNIPFMLSVKANETAETAIKAYEKPDYSLFNNARLPKLIQRPSNAGNQPAGPIINPALGLSRATPTGIK